MANDTEDSFDRAMHSAFDAGVQLDQLSLDGELDEEARREASRLVERARVSLAQGELEHSLDALSSAWSRYPLPILVDEIACDPAFTPLRGAARFRLFEAASLTAQARQTDDVAAAFALVERATALAPEYVPAYEYWESLARRIPDALEAARATRARLRIPMQSAQALCFWLLRTLHDEAALPELIVARLAERHAGGGTDRARNLGHGQIEH